MTTVHDTTLKKPLTAVILRRTAIALALFALIIVPAAILLVITKQPSATYASMGALIGAFALLAGGLRIGILTSLVAALLAPLAIVAGLSPITGAVLMILMTLMVGRLSLFGLHRATMLVPIFLAWPMLSPIPWLPRMELGQLKTILTNNGLTLTAALSKAQASGTASTSAGSGASATTIHHAMVDMRLDTTYLSWVIAFFFLGAIVPVLVLHVVLRKRSLPTPKPNPRSEALNYTITICVLTGIAMYYFIDLYFVAKLGDAWNLWRPARPNGAHGAYGTGEVHRCCRHSNARQPLHRWSSVWCRSDHRQVQPPSMDLLHPHHTNGCATQRVHNERGKRYR